MRSDVLSRHMKTHDKHVEVEPLSSVTSSDVIPLTGSNDTSYKLTSMDEEMLLKKMLKSDRIIRTAGKYIDFTQKYISFSKI